MDKLVVLDTCVGCGMCLFFDKYFQELENGKCKAIENICVSPNDKDKVLQIVKNCPSKSIEIKTTSTVNKNEKELLLQNFSELKKQLDNINIKRVNNNDLKFDINKYYLDCPNSINEITTDYKSKSSAKSAAKSEFNKLVYGEEARTIKINKVLTEYKVKVANSFYNLDNLELSYYHKVNKGIEELLDNFIDRVETMINKKLNLPVNFSTISVYPNKNDLCYIFLSQFPINTGFQTSIWNYVKDLGPTSLEDYVDYMDFDYFDWSDGGFFSFTQRDWNYSNFDKATDEFNNDLKRAFNYYHSDIEKYVGDLINSLLEDYEIQIKKVIFEKIIIIQKELNNII